MKKVTYLCFFIFLCVSASAAKLDINIIYEASRMKVKETVCGWQPDLSAGYIETEEGCYQTRYELDVPMYGFTFEPRSGNVPEAAKCAYYISFFDSAIPKEGMVKTEITANGKPLRTVENLMHDRTFQGLVILAEGESIRLSTEKEPSYIIIYITAVSAVAAGLFLILRRKKG